VFSACGKDMLVIDVKLQEGERRRERISNMRAFLLILEG